MITYNYTITKEFGIHARPAVLLAKIANQFESLIELGNEEHMVDAKDVMEIMCLMLREGDQMCITCEGTDEQSAMQSMIDLVEAHL